MKTTFKLINSLRLIILILTACFALLSCSKSTGKQATEYSNSESSGSSGRPSSLYAQVDTLFRVERKAYKISIKQYDVTEIVASHGDSTFAPAYSFVINITDGNKILLRDSLDRNSWGFPGKFNSIDHYEMGMPSFELDGEELITKFLISDRESGYAINGKVGYSINAHTARYFWNEADTGE
jgi:hypothetical protein